MKISGFTLIRNGTQFEYPYLESLRSLLPLVDELVINVGKGEDDTWKQVQKFALEEGQNEEGQNKVIFFESDWQIDKPEKKRSGLILSEQTNLALEKTTGDWCVYLQADEVLHEDDLGEIRKAIEASSANLEIEALVFDYVHFYGSFDVVQESRQAYRREVRAIRRQCGARSVGDAQSFRKPDGSKLSAVRVAAKVFHYGWVRTPEAMREKTFFMDQLYHGTPTPENALSGRPHTGDNYRYKRILGLRPFLGKHPQVMRMRIKNKGWHWDLQNSPLVFSWRDLKKIILDTFERVTGYRLFEYRSYKLLR